MIKVDVKNQSDKYLGMKGLCLIVHHFSRHVLHQGDLIRVPPQQILSLRLSSFEIIHSNSSRCFFAVQSSFQFLAICTVILQICDTLRQLPF
jgi:hypothetical protein